jgi:nicotinate dehydrogenase subunit B
VDRLAEAAFRARWRCPHPRPEQDKVHGIWVPGPGSYGRNDAGDAGIDAALLSKAVGRTVRVQGMRWEGHGWDPKGPASIHRTRAALDKDGAVIGSVFESKGFSRVDIDTNESDPADSLAGQLTGLPLKSLQGFGVPAESYGFANKRLAWETVAPLLDRASPLRTAHLRDLVGPQIQFASESFIDEIAAAIGADPVAFRLRYLKAPRDIAVVKAAAERAGWLPRPSPKPDRSGDTLTGRGIAYAQRSGAVVPIVANSVKARDRAVVRGGAIAEIEQDLVDVTPPPALGRVIAFDNGMARLVKMFGGVPVRRIVATADMTAGPA